MSYDLSRVSRESGQDILTVSGLTFLLFAPLSVFCGLYLDDYSFLRMLAGASAGELWHAFIHYVPGRNLHIPFFYTLIRLTGGSVVAMHGVAAAFDAVNAALVYLVARRLTGLRSIALATAMVFVLAQNHGETHFWITLIVQCQLPTALVLTAFLLALSPRGPRLGAALSVYCVALFTYDQVFFLWPLLLAAAWRRDAAPTRGRYVAAAFVMFALNAAHITLRYLSPFASGGRPLIRVQDVLLRSWDVVKALGKTVLPWPLAANYSPWLLAIGAAALVVGAFVALRIRANAQAEGAALKRWACGRGWLEAAFFGAAWILLAYAPILFWYISPRHNLLPTIGTALMAAALSAALLHRRPSATGVVRTVALCAFVVTVVSNVEEGMEWISTARLKNDFAAATSRLQPGTEALFLIDAPHYANRAPAFALPIDVVLAASGTAASANQAGDNHIVPTRRGILYNADLSIAAPTVFRWAPTSRSTVIAYSTPASFRCLSSLTLLSPDGRSFGADLRPDPACSGSKEIELEAALTRWERLPAAVGQPRAIGAVDGLALTAVSLNGKDSSTQLIVEWSLSRPAIGPIALVPRIFANDGRLLFESVFPAAGKSAAPMNWPLVDDVLSEAGLKTGSKIRETFALRKLLQSPDALRLELDVYELRSFAIAKFLGRISTKVDSPQKNQL